MTTFIVIIIMMAVIGKMFADIESNARYRPTEEDDELYISIMMNSDQYRKDYEVNKSK